MNRITQSQFMHTFNVEHREAFNPIYFERSNKDIMDAMKKIIMSCERDKYFTLKVISLREIYDYEEIYNSLRDYQEERKKRNSKVPNSYDYIDIRDSDIMLLEVIYFVRHNGIEKQDVYETLPDGTKKKKASSVDVRDPYQKLKVYIALPRFVNKYYFRMNGNYYSTIFQIVDGSTYNNSTTNNGPNKKADCITFKSLFMATRVYRKYKDIVDICSGTTIRATIYGSKIFSTFIDCMLYILANYGMIGAFDFLDINCVSVGSEPIVSDEYFNFSSHNVVISVPKHCFQDPMVQSLVVTIYNAITKDTKVNDLYNIRFWIRALGYAYKGGNTLDKGLFVLDSVDGIYDINTRDELHLPDDKKRNIYDILRWIMREFKYLKDKDNVDVTLKRIRIAEYIAHIYATKISKGIRRISDAGKRVTLNSVVRAIRTDPMYIIKNIINMSNLVSYVDLVNDNDALLALKYTYKGISGLGEDGTSIQRSYRYVDASHAGILDLDASGASDPGMTGLICPMTPMYNGSFTNFKEPDFWEKDYKHFQTEWEEKQPKGKPVFKIVNQELYEKQMANVVQDYHDLRQEVIDTSLVIDRAICPFYNIHDPSIDYSTVGSLLDNSNNEIEAPKASLFTYNVTEEDDGGLDDYDE